jgi:hypothetical protein
VPLGKVPYDTAKCPFPQGDPPNIDAAGRNSDHREWGKGPQPNAKVRTFLQKLVFLVETTATITISLSVDDVAVYIWHGSAGPYLSRPKRETAPPG